MARCVRWVSMGVKSRSSGRQVGEERRETGNRSSGDGDRDRDGTRPVVACLRCVCVCVPLLLCPVPCLGWPLCVRASLASRGETTDESASLVRGLAQRTGGGATRGGTLMHAVPSQHDSSSSTASKPGRGRLVHASECSQSRVPVLYSTVLYSALPTLCLLL